MKGFATSWEPPLGSHAWKNDAKRMKVSSRRLFARSHVDRQGNRERPLVAAHRRNEAGREKAKKTASGTKLSGRNGSPSLAIPAQRPHLLGLPFFAFLSHSLKNPAGTRNRKNADATRKGGGENTPYNVKKKRMKNKSLQRKKKKRMRRKRGVRIPKPGPEKRQTRRRRRSLHFGKKLEGIDCE